MNRREFCQTTALFLASAVCVGAVPRSEGRMPGFRAKKIFPESWDAETVCEDSPNTTSFVRKKLASIRRNGCSALLLVQGCHGTSRWTKKIVSEASRFDLDVLVPASLDSELYLKTGTAIPLSRDDSLGAGTLQTIDGSPAESGGFLLLDGANDLLGLLLYDSSRCLWTSFVPHGNYVVQNSEYGTNDSRLAAARWIDLCLAKPSL